MDSSFFGIEGLSHQEVHMYLLLLALLELLIFFKWLSVYVTIFVAFIYALWYFDGKEYTGERRWEGFRSLRVWRWISPVKHVIESSEHLFAVAKGKYLFVFVPCATPSSLIWGIGLHGGALRFKFPVHYMVPPIYMWIPFVRDVLLWSGAVTYSPFQEIKSQTEIIRTMLTSNRAICYAPSNFFEITIDETEKMIHAKYPSDEMFELMIEKSTQLVMVHTQGEHERYNIVQAPLLRRIQHWSYQHVHSAFPLCYWYRLFHSTPPPPVKLVFGPEISCGSYVGNAAGLKEVIEKTMERTVSIVLGDKEMKAL